MAIIDDNQTSGKTTAKHEKEEQVKIENCQYAILTNIKDNKTKNQYRWILDSGASAHMANEEQLFNRDALKVSDFFIKSANGTLTPAKGCQDIELSIGTNNNQNISSIKLQDVLYAPQLMGNIISIPRLTKQGYKLEFQSTECKVYKSNALIFEAKLDKGHFSINTQRINEPKEKQIMLTDLVTEQQNNKTTQIKCLDTKKETETIFPNHLEEPEEWRHVVKLPQQEKEIWIKAMEEEMDILDKARVWTLSPTRLEYKPLPTRWTYKIKRNQDNVVVGVRARLVAKGCNQRPGYDYSDTYAPVIRQATIRILLTLAGSERWLTRHCDVKSAFLYGDLKETIYLTYPEGPWKSPPIQSSLLLNKAIYGLKQAARAWNEKIHQTLTDFKMERSDADPCLYRNNKNKQKLFIVIHVDDLLFFSTCDSLIDEAIQHIRKEYELKDLGRVNCYLGLQIQRNPIDHTFEIHQRPKIIKLVKDLGLEQCKSTQIPMSPEFIKTKPQDISKKLPDNVTYQKVIGSLMYLSTTTRPDVCISTNILGRSVNQPTVAHWEGVKRVVKYLMTTQDMVLKLDPRNSTQLEVFCDADWGGDMEDRKSTSGAVFRIGASLINWYSRKQNCVSISTAEAEYVAISTACQETTWIIKLMNEINSNINLPITMYSDSQSGMAIATGEGFNGRTKQIDIKYHYARSQIMVGNIFLRYCPGSQMLADTFTKPVERLRFQFLRNCLQII